MYVCWTLMLVLGTMLERARAAATFPAVVSETQLQKEKTKNHSAVVRYSRPWPDDVQVGCKELRAKKFISDGYCTSLKPIKEVLCHGHCMPIKEIDLPWWVEFNKYWAEPKYKEWRCVEAVTRWKKVQLMCENGETRTYKIKIVKSCRCKSYQRSPNETDDLEEKLGRPKRHPEKTEDGNTNSKNEEKSRRRRERERKKQERLEKRRRKQEERERRRRRKHASSKDMDTKTRRHKKSDKEPATDL